MHLSWGRIRLGALATSVAALSIVAAAMPAVSYAQLANSQWPAFHNNLAHTGLSQYSTSANPGLEKWAFTPTATLGSSAAIGADGTVYVGAGTLYAVNPDGTLKWSFATGGQIANSAPAIGADGTIYVGDFELSFVKPNPYGSHLYAINPDGTLKWSFSTAGLVESSPAIGDDGTVYFGDAEFHSGGAHPSASGLYALIDGGQGVVAEKWGFVTGGVVVSSPAIGSDGTIYVGAADTNLYAINSNGSEKWAFATHGNLESSPAIGDDGTVYVGSDDDNLYALTDGGPGTVTEKWAFATLSAVQSSPAIGADGTIYVGADENLYAINSGGTLKWALPPGSAVDSSPAIDSDGNVYVVSQALYAVGTAVPVKVKLAIGPTALSFPKTKVGTPSKPKTVKITNHNGSKKHPGVPVSIRIAGGTSVFTESNTCPPSLPALESCTITVTYKPSAATKQTGALMIIDNAEHSPQTVKLVGSGKS